MRSYIELIGRVTKAPEIRILLNSDRFALLIVETTETWHDRATGERRSRSTWYDVRISKAGIVKAIERTELVGRLVFATGNLRYGDWVDDLEVKRKTAEIVIRAPENQLLFLDATS